MTDKALEAAPDAAIVAKAMACSEWPKWLFDLTDLTNRAADEADMSTEQAVAFAVLSYLSALPGEVEVVAWVYRGPRGGLIVTEEKPEHAPEADPLVTLASLQAMQARAEKAEEAQRELGEYLAAVGGCGDGACIIVKPKGMHTNGGCRCASDRMKMQRFAYAHNRFAAAIRSLGEKT